MSYHGSVPPSSPHRGFFVSCGLLLTLSAFANQANVLAPTTTHPDAFCRLKETKTDGTVIVTPGQKLAVVYRRGAPNANN